MQPAIALDLNAGDGSMVAILLMAAGVAIIGVVGFARFRKTRRTGAPTPSAIVTSRDPKPAAKSRASEEHLHAVMAEMQELTRVCAAQIESRVTKLEAAIREADDRLARLDATGTQRMEHKGSPVVETRRITPSRPSVGGDELSQRVFALADAGRTPGDIARELGEHAGKVELILALRQESRRAIPAGAD